MSSGREAVTHTLAQDDPMHSVRPLARFAIAAGCLAFSACGGDETQGTDDHTPTAFTVLIDDVPMSPPLTLTAGEQVRVRLKFANAQGDDLDDIEAEHFGGLTVSPEALATIVRVADHHFQFDVTGGATGTGTVQVGFGHDEEADEVTFPTVPLTVVAP
jgi:hypothetical protein